MNDILFNTDINDGDININNHLKKAGVEGNSPDIYDPQIQLKLIIDVRGGLKLGIIGTPAYIVSGQFYLGQLPTDILGKNIR